MSVEAGTLELETDDPPAAAASSTPGAEGRKLVSLNPKHTNIDLSGEGCVSIGRRPENAVVLNDPRISGCHCTLYLEDGRLWVHDLSTNGTWVNDAKLGKGNRVALTGGEEIRLALPPAKAEDDTVHYIYRQGSASRQNSAAEEEGIRKYYHVGAEIRRGQFGEVKKGRHKCTGLEVAVKVIKKKKFSLDPHFDTNSLLQEALMMKKVDHPHIVKCYDVFDSPDELCIVLELVKDGDLFDLLERKAKFPEHEARQIFWQIVVALEHLHGLNIAHRDLKPENILVSISKTTDGEESYALKLTDFGLAKQVHERTLMNTVCGTPHYIAPEVVDKSRATQGYTKCVDLWSIGAVLYVLLSGTLPSEDVAKTGVQFPPQRFRLITQPAKDLIKKLMTVDPLKRITIEGVVGHPWMQLEVPEAHRGIAAEVLRRLDISMPPPAPCVVDAPVVPRAPHSPAAAPATCTAPPPIPADGEASSSTAPSVPHPAQEPTANGSSEGPRKRCAAAAFGDDTSSWWYWNHDETLDSHDERAWTQYNAAENALLERGFVTGKKGIKLSKVYWVNFVGEDGFTQGFQFRKDDPQRQRDIRRGTKASVLLTPPPTKRPRSSQD